MKPTHPVELLACAIATQEGFFSPSGNAMPQLKRNPGDIRFDRQLNATAPEWSGPPAAPPIATFSTEETGTAGLFRQLWLQVAEGQTVRQIVGQWAPGGVDHNNPGVYLTNVLAWTELPADTPVLDLLAPLVNLAVA